MNTTRCKRPRKELNRDMSPFNHAIIMVSGLLQIVRIMMKEEIQMPELIFF